MKKRIMASIMAIALMLVAFCSPTMTETVKADEQVRIDVTYYYINAAGENVIYEEAKYVDAGTKWCDFMKSFKPAHEAGTLPSPHAENNWEIYVQHWGSDFTEEHYFYNKEIVNFNQYCDSAFLTYYGYPDTYQHAYLAFEYLVDGKHVDSGNGWDFFMPKALAYGSEESLNYAKNQIKIHEYIYNYTQEPGAVTTVTTAIDPEEMTEGRWPGFIVSINVPAGYVTKEVVLERGETFELTCQKIDALISEDVAQKNTGMSYLYVPGNENNGAEIDTEYLSAVYYYDILDEATRTPIEGGYGTEAELEALYAKVLSGELAAKYGKAVTFVETGAPYFVRAEQKGRTEIVIPAYRIGSGENVQTVQVTIPVVIGEEFKEPDADLRMEKGQWKVYEDGKWAENKHAYVNFEGKRFLVANGVVATDANGLAMDPEDPDSWYFLSGGLAQTQYDGLAEYDGQWFYIDGGKLNTKLADYVEYDGGLFYVGAGRIMKEVSGLAQSPSDESVWYYVAEGQVQNFYTGLAQYDGAWFYVEKGVLASNFTGTVEYDGSTFNVVNGQLAN